MTTKVIVLTASGNWTVPADFTTPNKIEAIGGGQGGGYGWGSGGGGGAYTFLNDVTLTPGAVIPVVVGAGGAGNAVSGSDIGAPGSATNFNSGQIIADFGGAGGPLSITGGSAFRCVPHGTDGGSGGRFSFLNGGGGGGGAGGPHGVGAAGGTSEHGISGGSGGGAANGGTGGQNGFVSSNGGQGGTAQDGTPGGTGGNSSVTAGGPGLNGSGGGGGFYGSGDGGAGSTDSSSYGSGGGGAGGGFTAGGRGGPGGLFGGGGGGGRPGGNGSSGAIIITYEGVGPPIPPIPPVPPFIAPPPLRERTYHRRFLGLGFDPQITIVKDRPGPIRIIEFDCWMN